MANLHLPILDNGPPSKPSKRPSSLVRPPPPRNIGSGSLGKDGHRKRPYPADVHGFWTRARRFVYYGLIALWVALPWIPIHGHPAVFLDIDKRQFFLFGATFNAQDLWLLFFAVSGFGFGLLYLTTLLGRVWCGWACPQTVFIEGIFRPIERLVNGPRNTAMKRAKGPANLDRLWRTALTHTLYVVAALALAHVFLAYFVSLPQLFTMMRVKPGAHPEVFAWMIAMTGLFYGVFGIFREQFCVVMCPYGRLQSALMDDDSIVIGYDERRGEPRGPATTQKSSGSVPKKGDCVDCNRCVVVCPTGIDIRDGLQLDCIGCTACIDACDDVMTRLDRPRGLIRYDSLRGLAGEKRNILRPRVWIYTALLVVGMIVTTLAVRSREPFEANLLRLPGLPYTRDDTGHLRNGFELHIVNKSSTTTRFHVSPVNNSGGGGGGESSELAFILPMETVDIEPLGSKRVPFFVTMDEARFKSEQPIVVRIDAMNMNATEDAATTTATKTVKGRFLGAALR